MTLEKQVRALRNAVNRLSVRVHILEGGKAKARLTADEISRMEKACDDVIEHHNVSIAGMAGPSRRPYIVAARHHGFVACRAAGFSTHKIGVFFGGRDHTTVCHGIMAHRKRNKPPAVDPGA